MNKILFFVIVLLSVRSASAQDDVNVSFSVENDTLVRQRFIDRYEHVFMTKVPTRHMFKIGLSQYYQSLAFSLRDGNLVNNTSLQLGYEFKFLPSMSVSLAGHLPLYGINTLVRDTWRNSILDAQLRWYFNMKKRIREGKSANNFSGNYLAVNYTVPSTLYFSPTIGVKFGFQRRFLNSGFMDFAFAVQQESPWFHYGVFSNWTFSSQASFGIAFGDWKRTQKAPLCDLLLCNEEIGSQWKIRLPELTFGYYMNRIKLSFAYERKVGNSPFSINYQTDIGLSRGFDYVPAKNPYSSDFFPNTSLQVRLRGRSFFQCSQDIIFCRRGSRCVPVEVTGCQVCMRELIRLLIFMPEDIK